MLSARLSDLLSSQTKPASDKMTGPSVSKDLTSNSLAVARHISKLNCVGQLLLDARTVMTRATEICLLPASHDLYSSSIPRFPPSLVPFLLVAVEDDAQRHAIIYIQPSIEEPDKRVHQTNGQESRGHHDAWVLSFKEKQGA